MRDSCPFCDEEPLTAPNLERPTLEGARDGPVIWTVHAPDGFHAKQEGGTELRAGLIRAAALDLYRTSAQWEIVQKLAKGFAGRVRDDQTQQDVTRIAI